jgi:hypothetical protein
LKRSCSPSGTCQDFCTENDFCDTGYFCDTQTGQCFNKGSYCTTPPNPGDPFNNCGCAMGTCLYTISEGQTAYCAVGCGMQSDCPSGYDCTDTWQLCGSTADCPAGVCHGFQAVDETNLLFICADPTTLEPIVVAMNCAPMTGFCNGSIQ